MLSALQGREETKKRNKALGQNNDRYINRNKEH